MLDNFRLYKNAWIFAQDPHKEHKLSSKELCELFNNGGWMVRNSFDFDCSEETSFWYVIKDFYGGMDELSSKMRNQVKRCFKTMRVARVSSGDIMRDGYEVYIAAIDGYRIKTVPPTKHEFMTRIKNAEENEYWACFDLETEMMVAFSMNFVTDQSCEYRTMKALPAYQKKYAYYGLIYEMNRYYLQERGLKYVNDGARSLTDHSNIQPFLIDKFNFRKAYCHLDVTYRWWLKLIINALYPFRGIIPFNSVKSILRLEEMNRGKM